MDGKINITNENVADYVKKRTVTVNGGVWDGEKMPVVKMILGSLFLPSCLASISVIGYYFIELPKTKSMTSTYFEINDIIASFIQASTPFFICISIVLFFLFLYFLFKNFYTNKVLRAKHIAILLAFQGIVFLLLLFMISCLFIPLILGAGLRYFLIFFMFLVFLFFSGYWCRQRLNVFYKSSKKSAIDKLLNKVKVWVWPLLGIISVWSYTTAHFRTDARLAFYGAVSPFFILFIIPCAYMIFYYGLGEILELHYINKFPEAIRMETNFTKEEWYGPKYQKSKEVMRKIQAFEDYINN